MAEKDAKYYANLAASVAKKPTFDWPLVGILGMLKKFNPIAPASQWDVGPDKFDTDPQNIYGLHDWLSTWNPKMLRMAETIEPWFNPAINYAAKQMGIEEDLKSRSEFMDRNVPYEKKGSFLDRQVTKIGEKFGFNPDVTYNELAQRIPGVDAYGGKDRPDVISKYAEGVWAPSDEVKNLYAMLDENAAKGQDVTGNYQEIFNNPLYKGLPQNNQLAALLGQVDSSLLGDIQDKAFINQDEAYRLFAIAQQNLKPEQYPYMDHFFIDTTMGNVDRVNEVLNQTLESDPDAVTLILDSNSAVLAHHLRKAFHASAYNQKKSDGDLSTEDFASLLDRAKMSVLHATDAGDEIATAFEKLGDYSSDKNLRAFQDDYLHYSPSNKVGSGIFDMTELPMMIEDLERLPLGLGEATTDLKEVLAHGVETPWITPPTDQAKGLDALFNEAHPTFDWKEGVSMEDYTDEEYKAAKSIWDTMDITKRNAYMKETHMPVDIAILSMLPGRRKVQEKVMRKVEDPAGIETLMDVALPQVSKDLSSFDYGRL